ncbi:MHS family MFS transporter [Burkholderia cenocepacia]|uniref:MFS transporter n=1 Tax=Burkholderia cenocepacia TaxID=95486 RepID=UPI001BA272EA|nr:MFS transporter [Burkholderia cenocepacia]MBR8030090.1 MHS family MFS transporter [Burkholderia cenocepacia]MBR8174213.1 MHS family MFS transporter [Burkholderia cenocepacia]
MNDTKYSEGTSRHAKRATLSGWIGSTLEYYDFFIYAQAASLIFPQIFFPGGNPTLAIIASLGIYGVGYVARPIGAFFLGHWGDKHGRKSVLLLCLVLMGASTMGVGLLPTYQQIGFAAPLMLVVLRLIQGFAVAGEIVGASSMILEHAPFGRRGFYASFALQGVQAGQIFAAAVFIPLAYFLPEQSLLTWGWRVPFLLSLFVLLAGYFIRREVTESPAFNAQQKKGDIARSPIAEALRYQWKDIIRISCLGTCNVIPVLASIFGAAYAVQPAYGIGFDKSVFLWVPLIGNVFAVLTIPLVGNLSDKIGRRPPIIVGALLSGSLAPVYLYAISVHSVGGAITVGILMWGILYQGYNATFPSFMPELFPTRVRVSAMAIGLNVGVTASALLPALFAAIAPPGSTGIPLKIGFLTLFVTVGVAIAAWTARETYRVPMEQLGDPEAAPISKLQYEHVRAESLKQAKAQRRGQVA